MNSLESEGMVVLTENRNYSGDNGGNKSDSKVRPFIECLFLTQRNRKKRGRNKKGKKTIVRKGRSKIKFWACPFGSGYTLQVLAIVILNAFGKNIS